MMPVLRNWILIGEVEQSMRRLTAPMIPGISALILIDLLDSYLASRFTSDEFYALNISVPIINILFAVCIGLNINLAVKINQIRGQKYQNLDSKLSELVTTSSVLSLLISVLSVVVLTLFSWPANQSPGFQSYLLLRLVDFSLFTLVMMLITLFRCHGHSHIAGALLISWLSSTALVSMLFSLILAGALTGIAWAHLLVDLVFCLICWRLAQPKFNLQIKLGFWGLRKALAQLIQSATKIVIINLLTPILLAFTAYLFALHGLAAASAFGVIIRLEAAFLVIPMVLTASAPILIGQNYYANQLQRCRQGLFYSYRLVAVAQILIAGLAAVYAESVAAVFNLPDDTAAIVVSFLQVVPVSYVALGIIIVSISALNAISYSGLALKISVARLLFIHLPFLLLGNQIAGLRGVIYAVMLTNIVSGLLLCYGIMRYLQTESLHATVIR